MTPKDCPLILGDEPFSPRYLPVNNFLRCILSSSFLYLCRYLFGAENETNTLYPVLSCSSTISFESQIIRDELFVFLQVQINGVTIDFSYNKNSRSDYQSQWTGVDVVGH